MENLDLVRINPEPGEVNYYSPIELNEEVLFSHRELIELDHLEVGYVCLCGHRFKAILVPCEEDVYCFLKQSEQAARDLARTEGRCIIIEHNGRSHRCPRRIANPDYVEGGSEPKTIENRCDDCPYYLANGRMTGIISLSDLGFADENGDVEDFDVPDTVGFDQGGRYIDLCRELLEYFHTVDPKHASELEPFLIILLGEDDVPVAAKKLDKKCNELYYQKSSKLTKLVTDFLDNVDSPYSPR